jgi:hypothetical protein
VLLGEQAIVCEFGCGGISEDAEYSTMAAGFVEFRICHQCFTRGKHIFMNKYTTTLPSKQAERLDPEI